jgi:hypothetical protein
MERGMVKKIIGIVMLLIVCVENVSAHVVVQELDNISKSDAAIIYCLLGFKHILPLGFDHILFVLSLFLLSPKLKPIIIQSTAFTVAHSVTLCLAAYQVINPPARIIEPLIALSILYVALENIISPRLKPSRIGIVFLFGLIHGLGFAGALAEMGLPKNAYFTSLIMFNVGVEFGQLTVILLAWFLLAKWFAKKPYYRSVFVVPISIVIALIAGLLTIQRIFYA